MLSTNRIFHCTVELKISKSKYITDNITPKDDTVNWLFLKADKRLLSFVYKIINPLKAEYDLPFNAHLAFTMDNVLDEFVEIGNEYNVLRGDEKIGKLKILERIIND